MKTRILLAAIILLLFGSCLNEPPEPQLPPYTQEGKNIFACKIDGDVFIAQGIIKRNQLNSKGIEGFYTLLGNDTIIKINAKEDSPKAANLFIDVRYTKLKSIYELNQLMNSVAVVYLPVDNYIFAESKFTTNADNKGTVHIKYFQNKILAGTFEFTAIDDRGEVIHVTDGRFDISTN